MRIHQLRERRGWSQAELARRAQVRIATISEFENSKGNPRLSTLQDIASALGVSVIDLLSDEGADPETADLVSMFRRMDPAERQALLTILRTRTAG